MKVFNFVILGPQGSGKGTQASLLAQRFNLVVVSSGAVFREIAKEDSELGREIHELINIRGQLVRPELTAEVIKNKILKVSSEQGIILDGFPRTLRQYELLKDFWPETGRGNFQAIYVGLSEEEAIERLSTRVVCELCGEAYVAGTVESCQRCGGTLVQREDDKPEAIRKRLELFNFDTRPLIAKLEQEGKLIRIDGSPAIEEVNKEILEKLNLS